MDAPAKDEVVVVTPHDSSFVPVTKKEYRPTSTPFEKHKETPARLPNGVTEANVARTIAIVKQIPSDSVAGMIADTTSIVILKSGEVFVGKQQNGIKTSVMVTEFVPPILSWDIFLSIGINYSSSFNPSIALSPLKICDLIQFPTINLDPKSIGIGIGYCYKDFVFGVAATKRFSDWSPQGNLFFHYSIF